MTAHPEGVRTVAQSMEPHEAELPAELPVLFLVSQVIFPYGASQVRLRMPSNLKLLDDLPGPDAVFAVAFAPGSDPEKVKAGDIGRIGVAARVIARLKLPDGSEQVTFQGLFRIHVADILADEPYFRARVACVVERPGGARRGAARERRRRRPLRRHGADGARIRRRRAASGPRAGRGAAASA